jgi:hypothetical protein
MVGYTRCARFEPTLPLNNFILLNLTRIDYPTILYQLPTAHYPLLLLTDYHGFDMMAANWRGGVSIILHPMDSFETRGQAEILLEEEP